MEPSRRTSLLRWDSDRFVLVFLAREVSPTEFMVDREEVLAAPASLHVNLRGESWASMAAISLGELAAFPNGRCCGVENRESRMMDAFCDCFCCSSPSLICKAARFIMARRKEN